VNTPVFPAGPATADAIAAHEVLHGIRRCPNCDDKVQRDQGIHADLIAGGGGVTYFGHAMNGCLLVTLIAVLNDRGQLSEAEMFDRMVSADECSLWNDLGPVIDALEVGKYGVAR
jgi:hypothetical protein